MRIGKSWTILALLTVLSLIAVGPISVGAQSPAAGSPEEGEQLVRTLDPAKLPDGWKVPKTVGHVVNYLMHEWYQNETKGEQTRAADFNIQFSLNDANLDLQKSLAGVDDLLAAGTDAIVFTPVNEEASAPTVKKAVDAGKAMVCEGSPVEGCSTLVSIDDYDAGVKVGKWAGDWIKANLEGKASILDIGLPALSTTVARSKGFVDGITSVLPDAKVAQAVDGSGLKDKAITVAADALTAHPDVNVIFGINDDSALGGLQAYTAAGLDPAKLLVVGFGCEGKACKTALMEGGPYKVSAGMFPEYQGRLLINAAVVAFNGHDLPDRIVAPTTPITKDNLEQYYTKQGEEWIPNFDATAQISSGAAAADETAQTDKLVRNLNPDALPDGWKVPATVGHVTNYLMHEWYQNLTKGEKERADQYKIAFSINDANLDLQKSLAGMDDFLAAKTNVIVFTPVNQEASVPTIKKAMSAGVPVVLESSMAEGAVTLVAIDDYALGMEVGKWAGNYAKENLDGQARILDVGLPALSPCLDRSNGFVDGVKSVLPDAQLVQSVDGKGLKDEAVKVSADALTAHPDINMIFGCNDDSALGGLQAYTAAGLDSAKLLVAGFGCEGKACKSALEEGGPYKVSGAMFPEYQGRLIIDSSIAAFNGQKFPPHIIAPSMAMTKDLLPTYYTKQGEEWLPNYDAIAALSPMK